MAARVREIRREIAITFSCDCLSSWSLLSRNILTSFHVHIPNVLLSHMGWDGILASNSTFQKHRLTHSHIDTPLQVPWSQSHSMQNIMYYYYYSANYPVGGALVSFSPFLLTWLSRTMFACVLELFSVLRLHFLALGSVHWSVTCQITEPVRFRISMCLIVTVKM